MTTFESVDFFTDASLVPDPHPYFDYLRSINPVLKLPSQRFMCRGSTAKQLPSQHLTARGSPLRPAIQGSGRTPDHG